MTATYRLSEALSAILVLIAPTIIPAAEVGHPSTWALREPLEDFCLPEHKVLNGFTIGSAELNWIYNGTKVQRVDAEGVCHRCNDHIAGMWHQLHLLSMGTAIRLEVEPIIYTEQPYREDPSPVVDVFSRYKGVSGNLGMYASGIPIGLLVDAKGPKPGVYLGCAMLGIGYFALYSAYNDGPGVTGMPWLCLSGFLTGAGGCAAFSASIKTSALNWPTHRGTATAFPLSAFGLSAFFFSSISTVAFPDNTSRFLLMLAIGTFGMTFISSFFLRVIPPPSTYSAVSSDEYRGGLRSSRLHRSRSGDSKHGAIREPSEPGMHHAAPNGSFPLSRSESENAKTHLSVPDLPNTEADETSSLMSKSSVSGAGDLEENGESTAHDPHHLDIRGMALLPKIEFWELFILLGLLTGIGLMTINNIGNDAQALWSHYDNSVTPGWIQRRQLIHVSIISVLSFTGRLLSGIGSDLIVKKLHMSRYWCLFISSGLFCAAQLCGARIENPNQLVYVSGTTGLAYGFLFGCYPSIVAETFGVHGLSQNWGCMTLSPVLSGYIFNLIYGKIYDDHSTITPDGRRVCPDGLGCYRNAYWVTFGASVAGVIISLWSIRYHHVIKLKQERRELEEESREA